MPGPLRVDFQGVSPMSIPATPSTTNIHDRLMEQFAAPDTHQADQVVRIRRMVAMFERIYDMPSDTMMERIESGELTETDDMCQWRMYVDLLHRVA